MDAEQIELCSKHILLLLCKNNCQLVIASQPQRKCFPQIKTISILKRKDSFPFSPSSRHFQLRCRLLNYILKYQQLVISDQVKIDKIYRLNYINKQQFKGNGYLFIGIIYRSLFFRYNIKGRTEFLSKSLFDQIQLYRQGSLQVGIVSVVSAGCFISQQYEIKERVFSVCLFSQNPFVNSRTNQYKGKSCFNNYKYYFLVVYTLSITAFSCLILINIKTSEALERRARILILLNIFEVGQALAKQGVVTNYRLFRILILPNVLPQNRIFQQKKHAKFSTFLVISTKIEEAKLFSYYKHLFSLFLSKNKVNGIFSQGFICILHSYMIIFNFTMKQGPQKQILQVIDGTVPTQRFYQQNFQIQKKLINTQHHLSVEVAQSRAQEFKIDNYFAKIQGNVIVKITEIRIEDIIIRLIDRMQAENKQGINISPTESESNKAPKSQSARKQILSKKYFCNQPSQNQETQNKLRDTKNLVKNIMRLFQAWLQEKTQISGKVYRALSEMMRDNKFNNSFIVKISKEHILRRAFLHFCQADAQQFIKKSKIHDKASHLQALKKYQSLCVQENNSQQQNAIKDNNKISYQKKEEGKVDVIMQQD